MSIRMKEWGMLAAPGQPAHVRTQGLYGWERIGRSWGEGLASAVSEGVKVVRSAGELAAFSYRLRDIDNDVREELQEAEVQDWGYAWNRAAAPRLAEAVQELPAEVRGRGMEMARSYSTQASIEALRDHELQRIAVARGQWQHQVEEAVASGQEEGAARLLEAGRGVFVPEGKMEERLSEVRSRACQSRWEARLQAAPMETLAEVAAARGAAEGAGLPTRAEERQRLEESCARVRQSQRRAFAAQCSDCLRAGEEVEAPVRTLAVQAGILPAEAVQAGTPSAEAGQEREPAAGEAEVRPSAETLSSWRRWLDAREDGEESELDARLALATAPLPLAERRALLARLERTATVPAADRRSLSNNLMALYHAGVLGCPGDDEAQQALLALQDEGAALLAEQGADAAADWVKARRAGADNWVCFEPEEPRQK